MPHTNIMLNVSQQRQQKQHLGEINGVLIHLQSYVLHLGLKVMGNRFSDDGIHSLLI